MRATCIQLSDFKSVGELLNEKMNNNEVERDHPHPNNEIFIKYEQIVKNGKTFGIRTDLGVYDTKSIRVLLNS